MSDQEKKEKVNEVQQVEKQVKKASKDQKSDLKESDAKDFFELLDEEETIIEDYLGDSPYPRWG